MRNTILIIIVLFFCSNVLMIETVDFKLIQNQPVESDELITFSIIADSSLEEIPFIAWDFGDGSGLGRYRRNLTATHRYSEPGVYQIFARIQGEEIPLSVTQTVYKPVTNPRPTHSSTIIMDTLNSRIWVVNADNHSISSIDAVTNKLIAEITVGKHPRTLASDNQGNIWVTNEDEATISIVASSGQLMNTLELPYASRPFGICFDPQKKFAYVTLQGTGQLLKLDATSKTILQTVDVGRSPRGIAISSDGSRVFVTQFISPENHGVVREIAAETMALSSKIELAFDETPDFEDRGRGVPNYLSALTISPDGSELWVPSKKDNTARGLFRDGEALTFDNTVRTIVSKIDLNTSSEILSSRVDINDADLACAVEFSPYGNIAFIALQGNNRISMIDPSSNTKFGLLDSTGLAPQGLVFNADGSRLYVHNFMSRSIGVFNTKDIILSNNFSSKKITEIPTVLVDSLSPQVLIGKQIFYNAQDDRMNFAGYISCASCHLDGGSDERVWDFTDRGEGLRNTHSLLGRRGTGMGNVHWTANFDEIQDFENDIRNAFGGTGFMPDSLFNSGNVSDPLGDSKAGLSPELDALAAYVSSLSKVHPSPYRKQDGSLTSDAIEGKYIFETMGCGSCHSGSDFTDRASGVFHDVGTIQTASGNRRTEALTGFGTPTLKGIWETAPYLHDGSAPTLRDVFFARNVDNKHGDFSTLTETEVDQLVAYLLQLDESDDKDIPTTSAKEVVDLDALLTISPNPTSDKIGVKISESESLSGVLTIYSAANGKVLHQVDLKGKKELEIDLSRFTPGVYMLSYSNGSTQTSKKLIIN